VPAQPAPTSSLGRLLSAKPLDDHDGRTYRDDVSADGQRFLLALSPQASAEVVTVVRNWTAELKK
jgi:hypothetical protein